MSEVKDAFKSLDRNVRIVILQLRQEIKDVRETKWMLSEVEKQKFASRMDSLKTDLLQRIIDLENRVEMLKKNINNATEAIDKMILEVRDRFPMKDQEAADRITTQIDIRHLRKSPRFRKMMNAMPSGLEKIALVEFLPRLMTAAKEDAQEEPKDWPSLKKVLDMICNSAERDETVVEMVKKIRLDFEGWAPGAC